MDLSMIGKKMRTARNRALGVLVVLFCIGTGVVNAEPATGMSLEFCVETALRNNPYLLSLKEQVKGAQYDVKIAQGRRWPSLHFNAAESLYSEDIRLFPASYNGEKGVFGKEMTDLGLILQLPLYTGGQLSGASAAAGHTRDALEQTLSRASQILEFDVARTAYKILGQVKQLESIIFSQQVLKQDKERIQAMVDARKAARVDLLRVDVRLAKIDQARVSAENSLYGAWQEMFRLMGKNDPLPPKLPEIDGSLLPVPSLPDTGDALEKAVENRPDIKALDSRVAAQKQKAISARGKALPQISLKGNYGYRFMADPNDYPQGTDDSDFRGSIGVNLDLPLFEGGRIRAEIHREQALLASIENQRHSLGLLVQKEVRTAVLDMTSAMQRVNTQKTAVAQARDALAIEQEKYRLGKGTILDVLDAQNAMLEIETEYYRAAADYHTAVAEFDLTRGVTK
jgi:outer membrane protein TolC